MSREIKFRAWESKEKRWAAHRIMPVLKGLIERLTLKDCLPISGRLIIEQYTGLKDRHGTEIYEGDIVKWLDGLGEYTNFVVEWQENRARFCLRNEYSHYDYEDINDKKKPYIEVIGNINENPELLGGGE